MQDSSFQGIYQAVEDALKQGDAKRVHALSMQLLSIARTTWEKGEARRFLAWAESCDPSLAERTMSFARNSGAACVKVVDVEIEFWSLVMLLVKIVIAAIPALIILVVIAMLVGFVFGILGAG